MSSDWESINSDIASIKVLLSDSRTKHEMLESMKKLCTASIEALKDKHRQTKSKYTELHERRQILLPNMNSGEALDRSFNAYQQAKQRHNFSTENLYNSLLKHKEQEGAYRNTRQMGEELDQKASAQRNLVDLWIRAYNASHPPVQYAELNAVLTQNIDWNEKRNRIRDNRMATLLQQQKVKALQAEIVALEVDTGPLTNAQLIEKQLSTETQIEEQESALREVTMQIARLKIELGL